MAHWYSDYDRFYPPSTPREVVGGIKARSQRGDFARSWWAARWLQALELLMDVGRLSRGRSYARRGQVVSIQEAKGGVAARVQGSRATPYSVTIRLEPLSDAEWERVLDALAGQARFAAQLLAGDMPQDIEQAFTAAGVSLFPARPDDLVTRCSCPDWANPCKHVAATHYILGEQFDEDPFLLFRLRGRTQEQVMAGLRARRAGAEEVAEPATPEAPEEVPPLEAALEKFWGMGEPLEPFPVRVQAPAVTLPVLRRLGEPSFATAGDSLQATLASAYQHISDTALDVAFRVIEATEEHTTTPRNTCGTTANHRENAK
jgi:uncharacterized Zn finger protein